MKRFWNIVWRAAAVLAVAVALVLVVHSVLSDSIVTEIVRTGSMEDAISAQGILIKNETVYVPDAEGTFEPQVREGMRVAKGMRLGSIYTGQVDPELKQEWNRVNKRIETLQSSSIQSQLFSGDAARIDKDIADKVAALTDSAESRSMTEASELSASVSYLANHKAKLRGEAVPEEEDLDALKERKAELEGRLGTVRSDLYAENAGIFSSYLDGLEQELTPERIADLMPSDIDRYRSAKTVGRSEDDPDAPVCKVIDNFEYYVAASIDAREASGLKMGDAIQLRFPELSPRSVDATVQSLSADEGGRVVATLVVTRSVPDVFSKRKASVDIIKKQYKGLKVPVDTIRFENGVKGVYVIRESVMRFVPVEALYNDSEYAVVKEDATDSGALKLYDELVMRADQYEDGKLVR